MNYIQLTIYVAKHAGLVIYEHAPDDTFGGNEQDLTFGGDIDQFTAYMRERGIGLLEATKEQPKQPARQIEAPAKIRLRKPKDPTPDPLDALDALEAVDAVEDAA